jgi:hypothetical protein
MTIERRKGWRRLGALSFAALLALAVYAFAAANTVPATKAGDGSGTISGYTITAVHYGLNATNAANIDSVTFTLNSTPAAGSTMKIQLTTAGSWYSCTNVAADVTCTTTTPQATVLAADSFRVVVAD